MPRVAALKDVSQISDVIKVLDQNTFQRPIYAGNAFATVQSQDLKIKNIRSLLLIRMSKKMTHQQK